jgi:alkylated DNA repair dioxygenase AlkB
MPALWYVFVSMPIVQTLFPLESIYPEGFSYMPGFLGLEEEQSLLQTIQTIELHPFVFQGYLAKPKVASFGWDWNFETRTLKQGRRVPAAFEPLVKRVATQLGLKPNDFAELLVTEYEPGALINWHRDAPPFALIAGISLGADCTFRLRPHDKALQVRSATRSLTVARRSLYVMKDAARSEWQHSTAPVRQTRYSITLRTLTG